MIRFAVCDDEQYMLDDLTALIRETEPMAGDSLSVRTFHSAEELLAEKEGLFDIVLLDISMGGMSGMDAARALRARNENVLIIFITSMVQYAVEGYEVHAFGFLPKPVDAEKYRAKLLEAVRWHKQNVGSSIVLKCGTETVVVPARRIYYIDVLNHRLRVVTAKGEYISYTPLKSIEDQLPSSLFFRCHKSYLINFSAVARLTADSVVMKDDAVIPISKYRKNEMLSAFSRYAERGRG